MACTAAARPPASNVSAAGWSPDPDATIEGTWESTTPMGAREGGVCTISIAPAVLDLQCSPGQRHERFDYVAIARRGNLTELEATASNDASSPVRLRIETLRDPQGVRALRIVDVANPTAAPLRAYGNPDLWISL
jgi:hypothetical protein